MKSLAEMSLVDFPMNRTGGSCPGQVCPPPSISTKTTSGLEPQSLGQFRHYRKPGSSGSGSKARHLDCRSCQFFGQSLGSGRIVNWVSIASEGQVHGSGRAKRFGGAAGGRRNGVPERSRADLLRCRSLCSRQVSLRHHGIIHSAPPRRHRTGRTPAATPHATGCSATTPAPSVANDASDSPPSTSTLRSPSPAGDYPLLRRSSVANRKVQTPPRRSDRRDDGCRSVEYSLRIRR